MLLLEARHDRKLIHRLADAVLCLDVQKPVLFSGTCQEYLDRNEKPKPMREEERLVLETRLSDLLGRLSSLKLEPAEKEEIEKLYRETLKQLKKIKKG
ncbi:hypothetical protein KDJ56_00070 [Brevibacillus composti]|uniref:Uncharacterized protein n=1 Tax=Brevibacillus composti TaxID=2796470 RepID=A0A7T5JNS1_9BACL|nr:hypothetical protein [Brevibacillus composti]QQE74474.1 hypothetical protein JD108_00070 [Brevibacillus composti]QUO41556.1 hypothetical protein KDJ56_00070 [Brevibacillus composti]